ncbi:MAG: acyl-CoA dehydrogenase family protein, partial [Acidimicrobiales bacterium]|nr:acyl-CoA dehydrogenase family protein [Acidimicrobiales bacterium]
RLDDAGDVFAFAGGSDTPDVIQHHRNLMRRLFDGGFSGICYPKKYGGQGLTFDHLRAFSEEALDYELPWLFANPTLCILAPTILDCGSEEQKQRHLPAILKGEELWVQFLSEPSGGSDLAGVLTRATRDGEEFVITGSKIWTSGGHRADYAQAVVRTDWDAPKHAGISVIIVPIPSDGLTIEPIKQVNGNSEFCQEFLDEVRVPASYVLGAENDGWNVTQRMLYHEKLSLGGGSPYQLVLGQPRARGSRSEDDLVALARVSGKANDPHMRQLVAEGHISGLVQQALIGRVVTGMGTGKMPAPASALLKLMGATTSIERSELIMRLAGSRVAAWPDGSNGGAIGTGFLYRQAIGILGGTNEIQRNIISERFLGMPRELAPDKGIPFKDVKRNTSA